MGDFIGAPCRAGRALIVGVVLLAGLVPSPAYTYDEAPWACDARVSNPASAGLAVPPELGDVADAPADDPETRRCIARCAHLAQPAGAHLVIERFGLAAEPSPRRARRVEVARSGEVDAAEGAARTFRVGEVLPSGQVAGRGPGAALGRLLPQNARTTTSAPEIFRRLETFHGVDPATAGQRLHAIKAAAGRGPADNVLFDLTGNIYDPVTREWLGTLTQGF